MLEIILLSIVVNILIDVVWFVSRYGVRRTIHIDCLTQYNEITIKHLLNSLVLVKIYMSLQMMIISLFDILIN